MNQIWAMVCEEQIVEGDERACWALVRTAGENVGRAGWAHTSTGRNNVIASQAESVQLINELLSLCFLAFYCVHIGAKHVSTACQDDQCGFTLGSKLRRCPVGSLVYTLRPFTTLYNALQILTDSPASVR